MTDDRTLPNKESSGSPEYNRLLRHADDSKKLPLPAHGTDISNITTAFDFKSDKSLADSPYSRLLDASLAGRKA